MNWDGETGSTIHKKDNKLDNDPDNKEAQVNQRSLLLYCKLNDYTYSQQLLLCVSTYGVCCVICGGRPFIWPCITYIDNLGLMFTYGISLETVPKLYCKMSEVLEKCFRINAILNSLSAQNLMNKEHNIDNTNFNFVLSFNLCQSESWVSRL